MSRIVPAAVIGTVLVLGVGVFALRPVTAQNLDAGAKPFDGKPVELAQADTGAAAPTTGQPAATLPNGATSINETFGDWTVNCSIVEGEKACVFSQVQGSNQTGQRTFAIELRPPRDGLTEGVLLMPFGLKLADGVKLKIDGQNLGQGAQ